MWYREQSNQYINDGMQFVIDGMTYPAQWLNQATPEQKAELGLVEVTYIGERKSEKYYWVGELWDKATITYTNTPKDLADVKKNCVSQINATAYSLLLPTDWMAVRSIEASIPVPTEWANWRDDVRQVAASAKTSIEMCNDVEAVEGVMANVTWPVSPNNEV